jgi:hypothetical protein
LLLRIRVVGRECKICGKILAVVQRAVDILGIDASIRKVTVPAEIEGYHLDAIPGLVINDRVVCEGRIPTEGEMIRWVLDELESM